MHSNIYCSNLIYYFNDVMSYNSLMIFWQRVKGHLKPLRWLHHIELLHKKHRSTSSRAVVTWMREIKGAPRKNSKWLLCIDDLVSASFYPLRLALLGVLSAILQIPIHCLRQHGPQVAPHNNVALSTTFQSRWVVTLCAFYCSLLGSFMCGLN